MKKNYSFFLMIGSLMALAMLLVGMKYPAPLYSPGDIAEKHEKLRCKDCHAPFKRVPSESCSVADCHGTGKIGKKAAINDLHDKVIGQDCLICHTDHKGIDTKITLAFDHKAFEKKTVCFDCHRGDDDRVHKGKYGKDCAGCHNTKDWKKVTFSHDRVAATLCVDCHKGPKDDLHMAVGNDCKSCHTTKVWKPSTYDHAKYFPLEKEHKVGCKKCHDTGVYKKYTCMNCHVHATRGIINEHLEEGVRDFKDCLRCHRVYMKGRTYGTDRTGEGESMIDDDEHKYRRDNRYRRDHDDDDDDDHHRSRKSMFDKWFGDDD